MKLRPVVSLSMVRAGFDKLLFNGPRIVEDLAYRLTSHFFLSFLPGYRLLRDQRPGKGAYERFAEFAHTEDRNAPIVEVLYRPYFPTMPPFRLKLRAQPAALLDFDKSEAIVTGITAILGKKLKLSEVELTIDFPFPEYEAEELERKLYTPYARSSRSLEHEDIDWWVKGSRKSASTFRIYAKSEAGFLFSRLEWVLRRDTLRPLRLNAVSDLRTVSWAELTRRRFRFVSFTPSRTRTDRVQWAFGGLVRHKGIYESVRGLKGVNRDWLRSRLTPAPEQAVLEKALGRLEAALKPPSFKAKKRLL